MILMGLSSVWRGRGVCLACYGSYTTFQTREYEEENCCTVYTAVSCALAVLKPTAACASLSLSLSLCYDDVDSFSADFTHTTLHGG